MTDQIAVDGTLKRRAPSAFILYMNEAIASLRHDGCSDGTTITFQMRREFLEQWKNLADEERHRFQKMAKEEHAKRKALLPRKPKKRKMQNRISLNSIVEIVQKFSEVQRAAVIEIGLAGILQLKCKFLNHRLCEWLVRYFDPATCSLTVHGRILHLTESHVHDCLGINAQGDLVEVEKSDGLLEVCKDLGVKKGEVKLKDLKDYLQKAKDADDVFKRKFALYILGAFLCPTTKAAVNESFIQKVSDVKAMGNVNWAKLTLNFLRKGINDQCLYGHVQPNGCLFLLVVFYLDHVSPIPQVTPSVRHVPLMAGLGDAEIKGILHRFDEIGGYDNPGVVVHFRSEEGKTVDVKTSGNDCGVSDDTNGDVRGTNLSMDIVVGLLLRQNMLLERQLAYQMPSQMASQVGSQMPAHLHQLGEQVDQKMPTEVGSQKPRQFHKPGEQGDLNLVDPNGELHTHFMGAETSTPNPFQAHEDIVGKLKGDKYTSSLSSNISYEMPSEVERQVLKQVEPNHVDPIRQPLTPLRGVQTFQTSTPCRFGTPSGFQPIVHVREVHTCETSTPSPFETPSVVDKPKGDNHMWSSSSDQCNMGDKTRKRKIQQVMDEVEVSPSPLSGFKLRSGLSRGRKTKLPYAKCRRSLRLNKLEGPVEPPRLRQPYELKKSPYLCSPYTKKDGRNQRNQAKMQSTINVDKHVHDVDLCEPFDNFDVAKFADEYFQRDLNPKCKTSICTQEKMHYATTPRPIPLDDEEKLLTQFIFDPAWSFTGDGYVHLALFSSERYFATRFELCSLKPKQWILDVIINLVVVQLTNSERSFHKSNHHMMWYLPVTVSRQILGYTKLAEDDLMKMCDSYFGETNFTADIRHCSWIYIPTNDRGSHWFCIKVDMKTRISYIFDSKPGSRSNSFRKQLTRKVMLGLHKVLRLQYGDDYQQDVSKFNIANVERQPLQDDSDCYDCGLFVIKFMQGVEYPSGVHVMDDVERPRLLLDLFFDTNNVAIARVLKELAEWKFAKGFDEPV